MTTKVTPGFDFEYPYRFDQLWKTYPNGVRRLTRQSVKGSKKRAFDAWKKLKLNNDQADELVLAVDNRKNQDAGWAKDDFAFVPQLATYLNQRGWEDPWSPAPRRPVPSTEVTDLRPEWEKRGYVDEASYRKVTNIAAQDAFEKMRQMGMRR